MVPQTYMKIFEKLYIQTNDGLLNWEPGTHDFNFLISFDNYSISITKDIFDEDLERYIFRLHDEFGNEIDGFNVSMGDEPSFTRASDIFSKARRYALNIDKAIREIEAKLDKESELPF